MSKAGRESGQYSPATSNAHIAQHLLESCEITKGGEPFDRFEAIRTISTFFTNPWFRCVWVLREVWNAKSDVLVLCGRNPPVLWKEVVLADQYLTNAFSRLHIRISGLIEPWKSFEREALMLQVKTPRSSESAFLSCSTLSVGALMPLILETNSLVYSNG